MLQFNVKLYEKFLKKLIKNELAYLYQQIIAKKTKIAIALDMLIYFHLYLNKNKIFG